MSALLLEGEHNKFAASIYWLVFRLSEDDSKVLNMPADIASPCENLKKGRYSIKPSVIDFLCCGSPYYYLCYQLHLRTNPLTCVFMEQNLKSESDYFLTVFDMIKNEFLYDICFDSADISSLTDRVCFSLSIHLKLLDVLMIVHANYFASISQILFESRSLSKERYEAYKCEDLVGALVIWFKGLYDYYDLKFPYDVNDQGVVLDLISNGVVIALILFHYFPAYANNENDFSANKSFLNMSFVKKLHKNSLYKEEKKDDSRFKIISYFRTVMGESKTLLTVLCFSVCDYMFPIESLKINIISVFAELFRLIANKNNLKLKNQADNETEIVLLSDNEVSSICMDECGSDIESDLEGIKNKIKLESSTLKKLDVEIRSAALDANSTTRFNAYEPSFLPDQTRFMESEKCNTTYAKSRLENIYSRLASIKNSNQAKKFDSGSKMNNAIDNNNNTRLANQKPIKIKHENDFLLSNIKFKNFEEKMKSSSNMFNFKKTFNLESELINLKDPLPISHKKQNFESKFVDFDNPSISNTSPTYFGAKFSNSKDSLIFEREYDVHTKLSNSSKQGLSKNDPFDLDKNLTNLEQNFVRNQDQSSNKFNENGVNVSEDSLSFNFFKKNDNTAEEEEDYSCVCEEKSKKQLNSFGLLEVGDFDYNSAINVKQSSENVVSNIKRESPSISNPVFYENVFANNFKQENKTTDEEVWNSSNAPQFSETKHFSAPYETKIANDSSFDFTINDRQKKQEIGVLLEKNDGSLNRILPYDKDCINFSKNILVDRIPHNLSTDVNHKTPNMLTDKNKEADGNKIDISDSYVDFFANDFSQLSFTNNKTKTPLIKSHQSNNDSNFNQKQNVSNSSFYNERTQFNENYNNKSFHNSHFESSKNQRDFSCLDSKNNLSVNMTARPTNYKAEEVCTKSTVLDPVNLSYSKNIPHNETGFINLESKNYESKSVFSDLLTPKGESFHNIEKYQNSYSSKIFCKNENIQTPRNEDCTSKQFVALDEFPSTSSALATDKELKFWTSRKHESEKVNVNESNYCNHEPENQSNYEINRIDTTKPVYKDPAVNRDICRSEEVEDNTCWFDANTLQTAETFSNPVSVETAAPKSIEIVDEHQNNDEIRKKRELMFMKLNSRRQTSTASKPTTTQIALNTTVKARIKQSKKILNIPYSDDNLSEEDKKIFKCSSDSEAKPKKNFLNASKAPKLFVPMKKNSNRLLIHNAITNYCLCGDANKILRAKAIEALSVSDGSHFLIHMKPSFQYRGLYVYYPDEQVATRLHGVGPRHLDFNEISHVYRFHSDRKCFTIIPFAKTVSISTDGFSIETKNKR